jgi:4'-phosphopantetheinyl transferase EntD
MMAARSALDENNQYAPDDISAALRSLVPAHVCVVVGPLTSAHVTVEERRSLGIVDIHRYQEFATGRAYAKQALTQLGIGDCDLPAGVDRAPVWPTGVTGCISHFRYGTTALVAAAVCRSEDTAAVGIDVDLVQSVDPVMWDTILTTRELDEVLTLPVPLRSGEVASRWCAKESVAKVRKCRFDPLRIEIKHDDASGDFIANILDDDHKALRGRTTQWRDVCLAATTIPACKN